MKYPRIIYLIFFFFSFDEAYIIHNRPYGIVSFEIVYKALDFNQLIRRQQYNFIDFMSFIGGIFGLMAGLSFLSIVEVLYWFSVRMFGTCLRKRFIKVAPNLPEIEEELARSKLGGICRKFGSFVLSYLESSTVHSFNYLAKSNKIDKTFWLIAFTISMICCGFMIAEVDNKIPNSRVMSLDDSFKHLKDVSSFFGRFIMNSRLKY